MGTEPITKTFTVSITGTETELEELTAESLRLALDYGVEWINLRESFVVKEG